MSVNNFHIQNETVFLIWWLRKVGASMLLLCVAVGSFRWKCSVTYFGVKNKHIMVNLNDLNITVHIFQFIKMMDWKGLTKDSLFIKVLYIRSLKELLICQDKNLWHRPKIQSFFKQNYLEKVTTPLEHPLFFNLSQARTFHCFSS